MLFQTDSTAVVIASKSTTRLLRSGRHLSGLEARASACEAEHIAVRTDRDSLDHTDSGAIHRNGLVVWRVARIDVVHALMVNRGAATRGLPSRRALFLRVA